MFPAIERAQSLGSQSAWAPIDGPRLALASPTRWLCQQRGPSVEDDVLEPMPRSAWACFGFFASSQAKYFIASDMKMCPKAHISSAPVCPNAVREPPVV